MQPSSGFTESLTRSGLRTLLVAGTIVVAISNPYFGAVLGVRVLLSCVRSYIICMYVCVGFFHPDPIVYTLIYLYLCMYVYVRRKVSMYTCMYVNIPSRP